MLVLVMTSRYSLSSPSHRLLFWGFDVIMCRCIFCICIYSIFTIYTDGLWRGVKGTVPVIIGTALFSSMQIFFTCSLQRHPKMTKPAFFISYFLNQVCWNVCRISSYPNVNHISKSIFKFNPENVVRNQYLNNWDK